MYPILTTYSDEETISCANDSFEGMVARIGRLRLTIGDTEIFRTHWYYQHDYEEVHQQLRMALAFLRTSVTP